MPLAWPTRPATRGRLTPGPSWAVMSGRGPYPAGGTCKTLRVCYLTPTSALGGAERILLGFMTALRQAEPAADVELVAPSEGPLVTLAAAQGVRTTVLALPPTLAALGDSQLRNG